MEAGVRQERWVSDAEARSTNQTRRRRVQRRRRVECLAGEPGLKKKRGDRIRIIRRCAVTPSALQRCSASCRSFRTHLHATPKPDAASPTAVLRAELRTVAAPLRRHRRQSSVSSVTINGARDGRHRRHAAGLQLHASPLSRLDANPVEPRGCQPDVALVSRGRAPQAGTVIHRRPQRVRSARPPPRGADPRTTWRDA